MRLSPSALNLLRDCPRCFWLDKTKKIKRERGIFPGLPKGMDRIIKEYFDRHRSAETIAPELAKIADARLVAMNVVGKWRNWQSGLKFKIEGTDHGFIGALDDAVYFPSNKFAPVDYKTRGSILPDPKAYLEKYYGLQMSCYNLMLIKNDYAITGDAHFVLYWPDSAKGESIISFGCETVTIQADPVQAEAAIKQALEVISGSEPKPSEGCEYCNREKLLNSMLKPKEAPKEPEPEKKAKDKKRGKGKK